ncbi:F-box protein Pof2 [Schizosaccharomyces cryophilus OY26]|uniref:F-box protein Pof2 n=1 Tax=Schizosaccharomyces cryophilus (strain OY26 / ATCC MYA-4695 / CBS 11777 / NBRC 106824 / NRRL Y48691) TaxID=653667 RepID=S9W1I5_SCHCR|nr:F-box protein Pof2 [Schizosaccharomyces cryophilus OY26]EPY53848.1 F-box protein Pof2 [Schizosaccharomyces cryophilus OY26]
MMSSNISLPNEICYKIISYMDVPDLYNCLTVNSVWCRFILPFLWEKLVFKTLPEFQTFSKALQTFKNAENYCMHSRKLNLSYVSNFVTDGHLSLLSGARNLLRINLSGCTRLTDDMISSILLNNLDILVLDLSGIPKLSTKTMLDALPKLKKLKALSLSRCALLDDSQLKETLVQCKHLKKLKLNDCTSLTEKSLQTLSEYGDLIELDISGCRNMKDPSVLIKALMKQKNLKELNMSGCFYLTDFMDYYTSPSKFCSLRSLNLTGLSELSDNHVLKLCECFPRLQTLYLTKCIQLTDTALAGISNLKTYLTSLHLGHCYEVTDLGIISVLKSCKNLAYVDFGGCFRLTDSSVAEIAKLPRLQRVGLVKCIFLTDISIIHLSNCSSKFLERIHLSYCTGLTPKSISYLMLNCKNLKHLSVTGISSILCTELRAFSRPIPKEINPSQVPIFCAFTREEIDLFRNYINQKII